MDQRSFTEFMRMVLAKARRKIPPGEPFHQLGNLYARPDLLGQGQPVIAPPGVGELEGALDLASGLHHVVEGNLHTVHLQSGKQHLRPLGNVLRGVGNLLFHRRNLLIGLPDLPVNVLRRHSHSLSRRRQLRRTLTQFLPALLQAVKLLLSEITVLDAHAQRLDLLPHSLRILTDSLYQHLLAGLQLRGFLGPLLQIVGLELLIGISSLSVQLLELHKLGPFRLALGYDGVSDFFDFRLHLRQRIFRNRPVAGRTRGPGGEALVVLCLPLISNHQIFHLGVPFRQRPGIFGLIPRRLSFGDFRLKFGELFQFFVAAAVPQGFLIAVAQLH